MSRAEVWQSWVLLGDEVEKLLRGIGAWLKGHFVLASQRHSTEYVHNDPLFDPQHEDALNRVAHALAALILLSGVDFDSVTGPAEGGLRLAERVVAILSRELERQIILIRNRKNEREFLVEGANELPEGLRIILLEDTVTTGGSLRRYASALSSLKAATIVMCVAILNREERTAASLGFPCYECLLNKRVESYDEEECAEVGPCVHGPMINEQYGHGADFVKRAGQRPRARSLGTGP